MKTGKLEKIDTREVWPREDEDFTPWLAKEENLEQLSEAVQMDLSLEETEQRVGSFRADIVCRDQFTENLVLIENQFNKTDHKHLGQILTYAAGTKAKSIIWIAENFTEEHRATLDWLNDKTDDEFNFFGIEIEAQRINGSIPAPNFKLVSKPNNYSKNMNKISNNQYTDSEKLYLSYWTKLSEKLNDNTSVPKTQKPRPQHWLNICIGKTGFKIAPTIKIQKNKLSTELYINKNKEAFNLLKQDQKNIEEELGLKLSWEFLENKNASRIAIYKEDIDLKNENEWINAINWHSRTLEKFYNVFSKKIKNIDYTNQKEAA
tara:strand:+ start:2422 stop:3378 length:957 start_codon:yes stop_codon:yes gene_type:complete